MSKPIYNVTGFYKRGNLVYEVPTGAKPKKNITERRQHKKYRGHWDLTRFYQEHQR